MTHVLADGNAEVVVEHNSLRFAGIMRLLLMNDLGRHHAWVLATTPCSSTTAQFEIEAVAPKRRSARP